MKCKFSYIECHFLKNKIFSCLEEFTNVKKRLDAICHTAYKKKVSVFIDAEESWIQDSIDELCHEMMRAYNKEQCIVYNTAQLYRHDRLEFLKKQFDTKKKDPN